MSTPVRIQLRRTKGWRKPEGAIVVARPSKWGNPFTVAGARGVGYEGTPENLRAECVREFRLALVAAVERPWSEPHTIQFRVMAEALAELTGHDLACWCPLDQPCHADVLLEIANR